MNAQAILEKIGADGRLAAAALLKEAGERADKIRSDSEAMIAQLREETIAKAHEEAAAQEQRMHRMAELDERKLLLLAKRQLMDQTFQFALEKMKKLPAEQLESFFLSLVVASANGSESLHIGGNNDDWYTPSFLDKVNAALASAGKVGLVTVSDMRRADVTGVILAGSGMEINCTLEALLNAQRLNLEADVASVLYA